MSLRQVLSIYNAERQLNEDDTALLNTLRRLKDADRELLVQELSDKPQKKPGKKSAGKGASKSQRASGMAAAISNSLESSRKAEGLRAATTFCAAPDCGLNESSAIHDATAGYAGYHQFVAPTTGKPDAQSAAGGL